MRIRHWAIGTERRPRPAPRTAWALLLIAAALAAPTEAMSLAERIDSILADQKYGHARVGVYVAAVGTGRVIYRRDANRLFIVASNQKLLVALVALEELGERYSFTTSLQTAGEITGAVLRGDLVLRGGGDPTIGGRHETEQATTIFRRWAAAVRRAGIERITGDVVADDRFFDRRFRHPHWSESQAWKWWFPTIGALSVNDNCVNVEVRPGEAPGAPARVAFRPASAPLRLTNQCTTSSKSNSIWFSRAVGSTLVKVGGRVRHGTEGYVGEVTVPDPSLYAACVLKAALEAEGIVVEGRARAIGPGEDYADRGVQVHVRKTPVVPVLRTMLQESHNHYAEQIIKTVGAERTGTGSWETGLAQVSAYLGRLGYSAAEFELDDASGLSRRNRLTPALLAGALLHAHSSDQRPLFLSLLAVSGRSGTLSNRLAGEDYAGKVMAKTGYLNGVGALSGYARADSGIGVAFAILVNDSEGTGKYSMRTLVDSIARAVVDQAR